MATLPTFTMQDLIDRNEARYGEAQYRETRALLIHWEDDDLKAKSDLRSLEFVLRDSYAVVTRLIALPTRDYLHESLHYFKDTAGRTFKRELDEFIRLYSAPDILLLVIYLGRGHYDKNMVFTLRGFSKQTSKQLGQVMPAVRWAVGESGLIETDSDVIMLFDLRGDVDDEEPPCRFDTTDIAQQDSINKLVISYSQPGTPGDNGKSFAYTKMFRDHLRNMNTAPFANFNTAHQNVVTQIRNARDRGGVVFAPFCHHFSSMQPDIPLLTFDVTYPSLNILRGVGDHKWGPLGCLPPGGEKCIDNNDPYWRVYYKDPTGVKHATRSWSSAYRNPIESWDAARFVKAGQEKVLSRVVNRKFPNVIPKATGEWVTASDAFLAWVAGAKRRAMEEAAVREKAAREEAAGLEIIRQEAARQKAIQDEAIRQVGLEAAARAETARQAREEAAQQESLRLMTNPQNLAREQAARQEAVRQEAAYQETVRQEAVQKEVIRQQALEEAVRQEITRQKLAQGEAFKKQQEEQHVLQRSEALRRLGGVNPQVAAHVAAQEAALKKQQENKQALFDNLRRSGVTGLSMSVYAQNNPNIPVPIVPVRGRGSVKFVAGQTPTSYAAQEPRVSVRVFPGQVPSSKGVFEDELTVKVEAPETGFPQRSDYMARDVAVQDVKVDASKFEAVPAKVENQPPKSGSAQVKVESPQVQQSKTQTPNTGGLNSWQLYLARGH